MAEAKPENIYDAFVDPATRDAKFDPTTSPLHERVAVEEL